jgi:hypothetical protein
MNPRVVAQIALFVLGILVLIQLLFYNGAQSTNIQQAKNETVRMAQEIESLKITKQELGNYIAILQKEYDEIAASVPEQILQGFEDHEFVLAGFLDYVKAVELEGLDAKVSIQGARKYINRPVPLFEHDMTFTFSFINLSDAKKFLSYILDQDDYPLAVRGFELRNSGQKISGTLQASLLIPARQQKSLFSKKEEGK